MSEIQVKKDGDKWGAFVNDKLIAKAPCRPCVVKAVMKVTKNSSKYKTIKVFNEDDTLYCTLATGDGLGRITQKGI